MAYAVAKGRFTVQVRLNGYSNPTGRCQDCPLIWTSVDGQRTLLHSCCDDYSKTDCRGRDRCDSFFVYRLRQYGETTLTISEDTKNVQSFVNPDDSDVRNFSQRIVLNLDNPLNLSGLQLGDSYEVS